MKKGLSIKNKTALTAFVFMCILTVAIAFVGYKLYYDNITESYISYTDSVLEYAYRVTQKYSFGDMITARDMPDGYEKLRTELNVIKDSSDIEYLYAVYFEDINDIHSLHYAINAKNQAELSTGKPISEIYTYMGRPCEAGGFEDDTLTTLQQAVKNKTRQNGTLEGYSDEYGYMLNGYRVIYDSNDNAVGLIRVEIDINRINIGLRRYVQTVILIAAILTALIVFIYMFNIRRDLLIPIIRIAASSDSFVKKMQSNVEPEELIYEDTNIKSSGELSLLADNVKSLANGVASYMTHLKAVTSERERIDAELELATRIQANTLPNIFPAFPERTEFDIFASMKPAKEVGGDFYDYFLIDDNHLGLVMADVSGKGIPAAMFMMLSKILVNNFAMLGGSPGKVLEQTNTQICKNNEEEMFVTIWFGVLEISTGKVTAASAGHEYPFLKKANGEFELFKDKHGFAVGGFDGAKYREYEFTLEKGGTLFLYTDGVAEATNSNEEIFGTERMCAALNKEPEASPRELLENMKRELDEFVGDAPQFDDLTMLAVSRNID